MPTFILLSKLSTQGVQTLKSNPDRLREVNKDVEELGAKVLHQWATLGEWDFVNIVEAPGRPDDRACQRLARRAGLDEDRDAPGADDRRAARARSSRRRQSSRLPAASNASRAAFAAGDEAKVSAKSEYTITSRGSSLALRTRPRSSASSA